MGLQRRDGSIQSANIPAYNTMAKNKIDKDYGMYRCMILITHFIDDDLNLTYENPQVTYEALILGGPLEGQILQNVKSMNAYGGEHNYAERIWRPCEDPKITGKDLKDLKGDIVYIGFLQGNNRAPVIIGGGVQPNDFNETGATKADGFRDIKQYNGVYEEINKSGEFQIFRKGGTLNSDTGVLEPADGSGDKWEAKLQMSMDTIFLGDPNSSIVFKKAAKTLTTTVGSAKVTIDGTANKMTIAIGSAVLLIDGNSNKISLQSGFIDLGQSVSDFTTLFTELATAFSTHTHPFMYSAGPSPASGVSQPPLAPLPVTVGSQTVKLQP